MGPFRPADGIAQLVLVAEKLVGVPRIDPEVPGDTEEPLRRLVVVGVNPERAVVRRVDLEVVVVRAVERRDQVVQQVRPDDERVVQRDDGVLPRAPVRARENVPLFQVCGNRRAGDPDAAVRPVGVVERVVYPPEILVVVERLRHREAQRQRIVAGLRVGHRQPVTKDLLRRRAQHRRRNLVVRERLPRDRVPQLP